MTPKTSNTSNDHKIPFTLRLSEELIDRMDAIAQNTTKSAVARNYLNLSQYLVVRPDLTLEYPDGTQSMIFPKTLIKKWIDSLNETQLEDTGDELGRIINSNCRILEIETIPEKIKYLQSIGWFDIRLIPGSTLSEESVTFYGILAEYWPLRLLHAFIYRLLNNHRIPDKWNQYFEYFDKDLLKLKKKKTTKEMKDITPIVNNFLKEIGGHKENFENNCIYYKFDKISIPK